MGYNGVTSMLRKHCTRPYTFSALYAVLSIFDALIYVYTAFLLPFPFLGCNRVYDDSDPKQEGI